MSIEQFKELVIKWGWANEYHFEMSNRICFNYI